MTRDAEPRTEPDDVHAPDIDYERFVVLSADFSAEQPYEVFTMLSTSQEEAYSTMENLNGNSNSQSWVMPLKDAERMRDLLTVALVQARKQLDADEIEAVTVNPDTTSICKTCGSMRLMGAHARDGAL